MTNYKVTNVYKTVSMDARGNFVDIYEVTYSTKDGVTSTVEIPVSAFSTEEVKRVIESEVNVINEVMSLEG